MSVVDVFQGFNPSWLACRSKKTTAKVNPTFLRALSAALQTFINIKKNLKYKK